MEALITVIIPYYKGEKYIHNLLNKLNILASSFICQFKGL